MDQSPLLPPAYVVRREGNSFTLLVCSRGGGYLYPIMLCNISQNAMGQLGGGYPARSSQGGYPARSSWGGVPWPGGVSWPGGYPGQGGYPGRGGTLARGGTQLGQHRSTCYTAGGMPLAFMQEDFLV